MLDNDLAELYGVLTKNLNKAVKRNRNRFPADFMFQLTAQEAQSLRFQFGTSNDDRGGRRYLPYVFTQEGVAMLSGVLRSARAVKVNVAIMRAFIRLKSLIESNKQIAKKVDQLEKRLEEHDVQLHEVFNAIRHLMKIPIEHKQISGFQTK